MVGILTDIVSVRISWVSRRGRAHRIHIEMCIIIMIIAIIVLYSFQNGIFENAVEKCRDEVVKNDLDGEIRGAWLLTE